MSMLTMKTSYPAVQLKRFATWTPGVVSSAHGMKATYAALVSGAVSVDLIYCDGEIVRSKKRYLYEWFCVLLSLDCQNHSGFYF